MTDRVRTHLLVVGAGPYGLSVAAHAKRVGIETTIVGEPMGFWRRNMPPGMLLRSGVEWQLDPTWTLSFEAYLGEDGRREQDVLPIPVELFLDYADWFVERSGLEIRPIKVARLEPADGGRLEATFDDGKALVADEVVAAPGLAYFAHVPAELERTVPPERLAHSSVLTDFAPLAGKRVLIVGGRQSAFEWAALMAEADVAAIHVVHRHDTPRFERPDWSFVRRLLERTAAERGWFRSLPPGEQEAIDLRMRLEGRLKLEPWLRTRLARRSITSWPNTVVVAYRELHGGAIEAGLSSGERLVVDQVVAATGYRVDVGRVPYLRASGLAGLLETREGSPVLDEDFQTSVPSLYLPGRTAMRDFGPFFGFVAGAPVAASIIVSKLLAGA